MARQKEKQSGIEKGNKKNDNTKAGPKWKSPSGKWYIQNRDKVSSKRPKVRQCDADEEESWGYWTSCSEGEGEPGKDKSEAPDNEQ